MVKIASLGRFSRRAMGVLTVPTDLDSRIVLTELLLTVPSSILP